MLAPGDVVYLPKDDISEFNVFVNKLMPTAQLFNMITTPITLWKVLQTNE
jgi:polysaccharide biosynthesis/export protein